jgi:tRNA G18 (ribose-2'-O)-methylase SpoU
MRGFFGIGIEHTKTEHNIGTLWRSANLMGAQFIFTVGRRYSRQSSDTLCTTRHIPLFHYSNLDDLWAHLPHDCRVIGVELDPRAVQLRNARHYQRAVYLLGAEDHGLTKDAIARCHQLVQLPGRASMNVAVAGSIVMYDRWQKQQREEATENNE